MSTLTFGRCTPILRVADLEASLVYYTRVLGFTRDWGDRRFAQVTRGDASRMLSQGEQHVSDDGDGVRWLTQPDGSWRAADGA